MKCLSQQNYLTYFAHEARLTLTPELTTQSPQIKGLHRTPWLDYCKSKIHDRVIGKIYQRIFNKGLFRVIHRVL